jgi:hypothetical protein
VAKCAAGLTKDAIPIASISLTNIARHVVSVLTAASSSPVFDYVRGRGTLVLRRLLQTPAAQKIIGGYIFDSLRPPYLDDEDAGGAMLTACMADTAVCPTFKATAATHSPSCGPSTERSTRRPTRPNAFPLCVRLRLRGPHPA